MSIIIKRLENKSEVLYKHGQNESARPFRLLALLLAVGGTWLVVLPAWADDQLDANGATFRDFSKQDNGASFSRVIDMTSGTAADQTPAKIVSIDQVNSLARIRFDSVKIQVGLPLGWQAAEDWERGIGFSADRSYRLIVWRVDFAFEGVRDAEHYAATKAGSVTARRPRIQARARKLGDGSFLIVYENVPAGRGDSEPRTVFDLVMPRASGSKDGVLLTLGVPASAGINGLKLLALLKLEVRSD